MPDLGRNAAIVFLLIIVVVAAAARARYLNQFDSSRFEMMGDNAHHFNIAHNIAAGRGPVTDFIFAYWFHHPRIPAMSDFYPPGYHYSVAAAFNLFGESIATARAVSLAWSLASVVAIYLFASAVFGRGVGVLAAGVWALNRVEITHSVAIMAESQFNAIFFFGAWTAVLSYRSNRAWAWAVTGLLAGAATLTKGLAYPLLCTAVILLAVGWFKGRWPIRRALAMLLLLGACYVIPQAHWAWQTKAYFGKPLFSHGYSVMICNDWSKSTYRTTPPTLSEYLAENPPGYPIATRLRHIGKTILALPMAVTFGIPGAVIIALGAWLTRGKKAVFIIGMGVLYYAFVLLAAGGDMAWRERYLLPAIALMCMLAGATLARATGLLPWRHRETFAWSLVVAATVLAGWFTLRVPSPPQDLPRVMAYERLGAWTKGHISPGAPLMCMLVQDVVYATGHPCVMDATRSARNLALLSIERQAPATYASRSTEEARFYGVRYLVADPNTNAGETPESLVANLPGLTLELVYTDREYPLWLYEIRDTAATAPASPALE